MKKLKVAIILLFILSIIVILPSQIYAANTVNNNSSSSSAPRNTTGSSSSSSSGGSSSSAPRNTTGGSSSSSSGGSSSGTPSSIIDDSKVEQPIDHTVGEIIDEAGKFIDAGKSGADSKINPTDLKEMSDTLYNILLVVGIIIAILVGLIMGIKFIMGSLEEKAEIKNMLIPYVIGCVVVFGAFTIWQIVVNLLQSM